MTQYLLAVHHAGTFPDLPFEEWRQSFADTGAFNAKLTDAGAFDERDMDELLTAYPGQ